MKKTLILAGLTLLTLAACDKTPKTEPQPVDFSRYSVRLEPVITRATETNFENGDAIGLSITRAAGSYATNEKLTYDGSAFSGSLNWYSEGTDEATLKAYYPYIDTEDLPTRFTVESDQSAGTASSDFISAVKEGVLPSANAVSVVFRHQLSRLVVTVKNNSGADIEKVSFKEIIPVALIDKNLAAKVDQNAKWQEITAFGKDDKYYAIVPGQTVTPTVVVTAGGKELSQQLAEATLEPGKQYSVSIVVNKEEIKVVLAGEIENWNDGGEITGGGPALEEHLTDGYILYDGTRYSVAQMKDGKWWMTQNLRYVPEGITVSDNLSAVTAGVFYPIVVNEGQTAAEFSKDITVINAKGYLYQAEVALGLKVGDLTSVAQAEALESAQGICPKGWHVPTIGDITGLVGKAVSPIATNAEAPYYDGNNGSIPLLNADGFNMEAYGAISIADNTKTAGTFMGFLAAYKEHIATGMFCGSSYAGVTYNTNGDPDSGVKNLQFYGFMPMTNKATEAEYTCNGTKVSYRIAAPLRCVRD